MASFAGKCGMVMHCAHHRRRSRLLHVTSRGMRKHFMRALRNGDMLHVKPDDAILSMA